MQLPPELLEPQHFEVWPENWPAVALFMRFQTQWRTGYRGPTGLDYGAVITAANLYGMTISPAVMDDLQIIEAEVLHQLDKREKR